MNAVKAISRKPAAPWHTVRLYASWQQNRELYAHIYEMEDSMRTVLARIATKHRISLKRTRVVFLPGAISSGCYGYIRVYCGEGTPAERRLFKRVLRTASSMEFPWGRVEITPPSVL